MSIISQLINDVIILGGIVGLSKTPLLQFVVKNKEAITHVVEDAVEVVKDVAKFPAMEAIKAELHHKLNNALDELKKSELGRLAALSLNAFENALHDLSDDQKKAIILNISTILQQKGINVSKDEIEKALDEAQKASNEIEQSPIIQAANKFTQEQIALKPELQQSEK
jgi:CRISPR/Cas system-associated protein Cas10 (large subunit of type III CRISPR-Cas system)